MPLFIAHSRTHWGLLIAASDLDHAKSLCVEEIGFDAFHVKPFDGPLAFEFSIPALVTSNPRGGESLDISSGSSPLNLTQMPFFEVSRGGQGYRMRRAVLSLAFPSTHHLYDSWENDPERPRGPAPEDHFGLVKSTQDKRALALALAEDLGPNSPDLESKEPRSQDEEELDALHEMHQKQQNRRLLLCEQMREHVLNEQAHLAMNTARTLLGLLEEDLRPYREA